MAVTDLTGTMWVINENPTINTTIDFPNDFTVEVNGTTYIGGQIFYVFISNPVQVENKIIRFNNPSVDFFTNGVWVSNEYKTWIIKSEIPSDLLAWLQSNATLQSTPSTDTKPIFKRVNGSWVKQDAFERVSGAWVKISSKEEVTGNYLITSSDEILQDSNGNYLEFTPQLPIPQNVSVSGTTVTWGAVENATSYAVLADGSEIGTVEGTVSKLISFTIGDTSYQAEEGMTWGEWVESSYNTISSTVAPDGKITYPPNGSGNYIGLTDNSDNDKVVSTDIIIAQMQYYGQNPGGQ